MFTPVERAAPGPAEVTADPTNADAQASADEAAREILSEDVIDVSSKLVHC
ncbi:hypothetical protein [Streptomyces canus]|uniref:hypothetical protein n=1 Tax=Streptomyces canus TaxID=58343 RepID=UPI0032445380